MLWTIILVLLVLWVLGVVAGYTAGGLVHILLLIAAVVLIVHLIHRRSRPTT